MFLYPYDYLLINFQFTKSKSTYDLNYLFPLINKINPIYNVIEEKFN